MAVAGRWPRLGIPTVLVYRECRCGWWCATAENDLSVTCPHCSHVALPGGGRRAAAMYGPSPEASAYMRRLGFVAVLMHESSAVSLWHRLVGLLGLWMPRSERFAAGGMPVRDDALDQRHRHYDEREIGALEDEINDPHGP